MIDGWFFSGFLVNISKVSELIIGLFFYHSDTFLGGGGGAGPFCTQRLDNYDRELLKGWAK